jgi:hypothetical protein
MEKGQASRLDRLDRYQGVNNSYKLFTVIVKIPSELICQYQTQVMAITSLSLLCRWCSEVYMVFEDCDCIVEKFRGEQFSKVIDKITKGHYGCKVFSNKSDPKANASLCIGQSEEESSFWINCNDWLAGYGYGLHRAGIVNINKSNPLGAAFAACLGVAELFRAANGQNVQSFSKWYSLLDFHDDVTPEKLGNNIFFPTNFDLGNILQVGCGAVGSNFLFFLSMTDWLATIDLVDYDRISIENVPNSMVFNEDQLEHNKVDVCYNEFNSHLLNIRSVVADYSCYKQMKSDLNPDIILCFANERNIWQDIQYNLPPLTYHATTNRNWGINFGRHIPVLEWCLTCRFENEIGKPIDVEFGCSTGVIKNETTRKEIIGMLPFLSAASSLLVLTDLAKLSSNNFPINYNFLEFSFATRCGLFVNLPNKRKPCYICKTQDDGLYKHFRRNTKYWYLSD